MAAPLAHIIDHPRLDAERQRIAARALTQLRTLREVGRVLDASKLRWMLWKGPALAQQAWGDATLRASSDLDIVLAPAELPRALFALREAGWRAKDHLSEAVAGAVHRSARAIPLDRTDGERLELHWAFAGAHYPARIDVIGAYERAEVLDLAGTVVRTPRGADALLALALHATKHGWSQAEEVLTFVRLANRWSDELPRVVERAERGGLSRTLRLAVALGRTLLGASAELAHWPSPDTRAETMAGACLARMCVGDGAWRETHRWTLEWLDRPGDRLRYLAVALFAPTPTDAEWVRLPDGVVGAYPAVRVARLALRTVGLGGPARR